MSEVVGAMDWLARHGYHLVHVDCATWRGETDLHAAMAKALDFPRYYGKNLNALRDCLDDVACYAYGTREDATGTVLVLNHYDAFARIDSWTANRVLDIIAATAHSASIIGHRLFCIVQTDDANIKFRDVGATSVRWSFPPDEDATESGEGEDIPAPASSEDIPAPATPLYRLRRSLRVRR